MKINKRFTFEAAHRLRNHDGKCRFLHGHGYKVEVTIEGPVQEDVSADEPVASANPQTGMVLDFGQLKKWWAPLESILDHSTILEEDDPLIDAIESVGRDGNNLTILPFPPTAENIAAYLLERLQNWLLTIWPQGFITPHVKVWETETSWAEA